MIKTAMGREDVLPNTFSWDEYIEAARRTRQERKKVLDGIKEKIENLLDEYVSLHSVEPCCEGGWGKHVDKMVNGINERLALVKQEEHDTRHIRSGDKGGGQPATYNCPECKEKIKEYDTSSEMIQKVCEENGH